MSESVKKGGMSVETEHIFPVIKKWLYSEKDIFLREIVSNAADAVISKENFTGFLMDCFPIGFYTDTATDPNTGKTGYTFIICCQRN